LMEVKKCFVLGAGIMGTGIAQLMAQNGIEAILVDLDEAIVKRSLANIEKGLQKRVDKGKMSGDEVKDILGRIKISTKMEDAADADFIIEAIVENVEIKQKVFKKLEEIAREDVILATNTTACSISEIASAVSNPNNARCIN